MYGSLTRKQALKKGLSKKNKKTHITKLQNMDMELPEEIPMWPSYHCYPNMINHKMSGKMGQKMSGKMGQKMSGKMGQKMSGKMGQKMSGKKKKTPKKIVCNSNETKKKNYEKTPNS